ncbi:acetate kinase, partial [Coprococcus eutactus]|nr:acetate kinase [Coprococcus eutactus]
HQTMPDKAYTYAIPYEYYEKNKISRYGFRGTSHSFVSKRLPELLGKDIKDTKKIICHLGNGSSITAVDG